jgi:very-short-patch-repair endonuclease
MTKIFNKPSEKIKRIKLRKEQTPSEAILWEFLRNKKMHGVKFKRQFSIEYFVIDFYASSIKLAVEVDGEIHDLAEQKEYDKFREECIREIGIDFLRFKNSDIKDRLDEVVDKISSMVLMKLRE